MIETQVAAAWLVAILGTDPTLISSAPGGVWEEFAPEGTVSPWISFSLEPSEDVVITGALRLLASMTATVKVVGQTRSFADLESIASRIDTLINRGSGAAGGGHVISCVRQLPVRYSESADVGGQIVVYKHLGGQYQIQVQSY